MLRRLRINAGLTQERLAEVSAISANGVAALEAGRRKSPRLTTVALLCDALQLPPDQRAALIAAARKSDEQPPQQTDVVCDGVGPASKVEPVRASERWFIGRADERRALQDAWARRARVGLLFGEAGVGKSTLAEEFAGELAAQGVTVLRGRSTQQQLGVFEAFVEPVRTALGRFDGAVPNNLRDLGRLVPGLFPSTEVLVPSRSDPAVERRLLFETISTLLSQGGATLLLLDDLHWADAGTLALLSFLAGQAELSNLMVLGTVRSTDLTPVTGAALAELRRSCTVARIQVTGLSRGELEQLVSTVAGSTVSPALLDTVAKATNGNPLYIKELTEHLLRRGSDVADEALTVPDGIRGTIELRVAGLSKEAQLLLRGAAVLGHEFDLHLAGELAALAGEELFGAVEDALLSGLLIEQSATTAAFSHGLVATTVYESTSRMRRIALHRAAATALMRRDTESSAEIVDVARHWAYVAEADPTVRNTAAQWSVRAGDAAAAAAAIDEAIACYERAAAMHDGPTGDHADTLARLGSALTSIGKLVDGREHLQRALEFADLAGDASVFARTALGLSASVRYTQSDPQRIAELEAAIEKLGPTEMVLRPALLATLRRQLGFVNTSEADRRRNEAAALVAEVVLAPNVSEELLISLGSLRDSLVLDDPIPLGELATKIIRVATARQDLPVLSTGLYRLAWSSIELADAKTLRHAVVEYRRIAEQLRRPYEMALSSNMLAAIAQIEGRYDDAEACGQEALAHAATIEDGNFSWVYFANSGLRAIDGGQVVDTFEMMRAVRADFANLATFEAAYVAVAAAAGERALANELLREQVGERGEILQRDWVYLSAERLPVLGMLAWGCGMAANTGMARILLDGLHRVAKLGVRAVRVAPVGAWIGPLDHHIGVLHRVLGELDGAEAHLTRALAVEDEMGGEPYRVRTLLELADVALTRGGAPEVSRARTWRGQAEDLATKLGLESIVTTRLRDENGWA